MSTNSHDKKDPSAPFAYEGLERVIHERARLSILSSLAAHPQGLVFNDLKSMCALTDGNLSRQIQLLQEAGMVEVWKGTKNNRPQTLCRLSDEGRTRFLDYINELEQVVSNALRTEVHKPKTSNASGLSPA